MSGRSLHAHAAIALAAIGLVAACNALVGTGDWVVSSDDCQNPAGPSNVPCYSCAPTTRAQILNACTGSPCTPFDNAARVPLDGGALPMLPGDAGAPDAESVPPIDGGATDPLCSSLSGGRVVYVIGSAQTFIGRVAHALENDQNPVAIVYQLAGSCLALQAIVDPTAAPMTGNAYYWDPNADPSLPTSRLTCKLDKPVPADIGVSDVFASTCRELPSGLDPSIHDVFGPVQTMNFVVPQSSTERTISAEAAYTVFGFGGAPPNVVTPWTDPKSLFIRNAASGTQALIAAAIGVPREAWFGVDGGSSAGVRDALYAAHAQGGAVAQKAMGILAADIVDDLRDKLRVLAFQDYGQSCAFTPDSTQNDFDKRNVRDGHYTLFGPLHFLSRVSATGVPVKPDAARLLNVITGVTALAALDIVDTYAKRHLVPLCAMHVTRGADSGNLEPYKPPTSCNCYFEERATSVIPPPGCTPCDKNADCPTSAPNCNRFGAQTRGYCEP